MKFISIVGARPQFIKLAPLMAATPAKHAHMIVHTGQHFDANMSKVFFEEMEIPKPSFSLEVGGGSHGVQTGTMLVKIESVLLEEKPDWVIVFGDTNSTLAGALAASKLGIPVLHIEAGLRSRDKAMPEEQNRIMVDHISSLLAVPTPLGVQNLAQEGITQNVIMTGDIMYDALLHFMPKAKPMDLQKLGVKKRFSLLTLHRASNTDDPEVLKMILGALAKLSTTIVFPIHPRTRKRLGEFEISVPSNVCLIEPVGYLEMLALLKDCERVLTDSGGLQKEAFFAKKPCITLRDTTEWPETLQIGANTLVMSSPKVLDVEKLQRAFSAPVTGFDQHPYGNGTASQQIWKMWA